MMEQIRRVSFSDDFRNEVQESVARAVETDPERFIERFKVLPQSLGGRFVSADTFKETFEQYAESRESRNLFNTPVHNTAAVLASEQFRRLLAETPQAGRNEVVLLTGSPGAGKTSAVLDREGLPDHIHAVYEGQLADPVTAVAKVEQVLKAGFKPVIIAVHVTPEKALDNTLQRFDEVGRGASINVIANIQGGLPEGLAAVHRKFGESVELRIWDKRDFEHPKTCRGWEHIHILESEGNYEHIRERLNRHLETRRNDLDTDAWRQASGEPPRTPDADGRFHGRTAGVGTSHEHRRGIPQENREHAGLTAAPGTSFLEFARLQGISIDPAKLVADGRIHRADVGETASGKNDASYLLRENGTGWVLNFKGDGRPVHYRPERTRDPTPEELAKIDAERQAFRAEQTERQHNAITESIELWNRARDGSEFPYLKNPDLPAYGLRQTGGRLLVPMMTVGTDGDAAWVGMQRIVWAEPGQSADKRFVSGTPTKGAFAVIPITGTDEEAPLRAFDVAKTAKQVVLCEGIGTALAIHHATGLPVIAAMSAQNLPEAARSLQEYLQGDVLIYADNDGEKAEYKGQICALQAAQFLPSSRIAMPEKSGDTPSGYDARDQLRDAGINAITATVSSALADGHPISYQPKESDMEQVTEQANQTVKETQETPETRLLREWREQADPVHAQRSEAQAALAETHHEQQKAFLLALEQRRTEHAAELAKSHPEMAQEHKDSLIALDIAKRTEQLQKQQAAEHKTLLSGLPEVPGYLNFLEQRAGQDAEAAKLLEIERGRSSEAMSIKGQRTADMEPIVLEGLTHEIETGDKGPAIHYVRDGTRMMTDRGDRLDVYRMSDREIEAALRLAEQKFDMQKGLVLTGSREFQERAAEIAGRLNLKIQNEDLQANWQKGQGIANEADNTTTPPVPPAGGIEQARDPVTEVQSVDHPIDHKYLGAEYVLARLDLSGREALQAAGKGEALTDQQRELLRDDTWHPALLDEQGRLTENGTNAYQRMNAVMEEDQQLQQQLRTRNIDEVLEKKDEQQAQKVEQREERTEERLEQAESRDEQRMPRREIRKQRDQDQDQGMGM